MDQAPPHSFFDHMGPHQAHYGALRADPNEGMQRFAASLVVILCLFPVMAQNPGLMNALNRPGVLDRIIDKVERRMLGQDPEPVAGPKAKKHAAKPHPKEIPQPPHVTRPQGLLDI